MWGECEGRELQYGASVRGASTGPKISSRAIRELGGTSAKIVGRT